MSDAEVCLADACRVIRYLRAKCAGIAHLSHGEDAAREGLMITEGWSFLDCMEPNEAVRTLLKKGAKA